MSAASRAKTAKARAAIAIRYLQYHKRRDNGFPRSFDDCFEMDDGDEVFEIIKQRIRDDADFRRACVLHGCQVWIDEADKTEVHAEPILF